MTHVWQFLAGLGIFLYGMWLLENSLKELAGRTFKIFLKKHTGNKYTALLSGVLVTVLLQSSSVVSFIVLAFVGAGILSMRNALAVIFGSNIGTTLGNWIVALLGFKFNLEGFYLPIIAIASLLMVLPVNRKLRNLSLFGIGFGLLFMGVAFMKGSIEVFVQEFDLKPYYDYNRVVFVALGMLATFLIQSSSATVVIVLSALSQNAIPFNAAVAIIIGSELGTSFKLSLGSVKGSAEKQRAAMGNVIFNLVSVVVATIFMDQLIWLVQKMTGGNEPLIGLVLFQTTINVLSVMIFFPFLNRFAGFLARRYNGKENRPLYFLGGNELPVPALSIDLMEKEVLYFLYSVIMVNLESFQVEAMDLKDNDKIIGDIEKKYTHLHSFNEKYMNLKSAEGEILKYYLKLNKDELKEEQSKRLEQLLSSVRSAMYSAKGMKDVHEDFKEFRRSSQDSKFRYQQELRVWLLEFYKKLLKVLNSGDAEFCSENLQELVSMLKKDYSERINEGHRIVAEGKIENKDIPTLLNVNREMFSSCQSIIFAVKDFVLKDEEADKFGKNI